jgi:hypothetical protein
MLTCAGVTGRSLFPMRNVDSHVIADLRNPAGWTEVLAHYRAKKEITGDPLESQVINVAKVGIIVNISRMRSSMSLSGRLT